MKQQKCGVLRNQRTERVRNKIFFKKMASKRTFILKINERQLKKLLTLNEEKRSENKLTRNILKARDREEGTKQITCVGCVIGRWNER